MCKSKPNVGFSLSCGKACACKISRLFSKLSKKKKIGKGFSLSKSAEYFDICSPHLDKPEIILRVTKGIACLCIVSSCIEEHFSLKVELIQGFCINNGFSLT